MLRFISVAQAKEEDHVGIDPIVSEFTNLFIWLFTIALLVVFVRYIISEVRKGNLRLNWSYWSNPWLRHRMAAAVIVTFSGSFIYRIWTWFARFCANTGFDCLWMREWIVVPAIGSALQVVGILCMIRVFTPDEWNRWTWLYWLVGVSIIGTSFAATRLWELV